MADPTTIQAELVFVEMFDTTLVYDGVALDPDGPGTLTAVGTNWLQPCGIKETNLTRSKSDREDTTYDCDPRTGTLGKVKTSVTRQDPKTVTLSGDMASDQATHWRTALESSDPYYFRVWVGTEAGTDGYYEGAFHVMQDDVGGQREGGLASRSITLKEADATLTEWVAAP